MNGIRCARCGSETEVVRTTSKPGEVVRVRKCSRKDCDAGKLVTHERVDAPDATSADVRATCIETLEMALERVRRLAGA